MSIKITVEETTDCKKGMTFESDQTVTWPALTEQFLYSLIGLGYVIDVQEVMSLIRNRENKSIEKILKKYINRGNKID